MNLRRDSDRRRNHSKEKNYDWYDSCDNKSDRSRDKDYKDKENFKRSGFRYARGKGRPRSNRSSQKQPPLDYPDYPVEYVVSLYIKRTKKNLNVFDNEPCL